jgi:hypothetical protein
LAKSSERITRRIASIAALRPVAAGPTGSISETIRCDQRQAVYRQGSLTIGGGNKIDCIIVDASPNGARVELDGACGLPDFVVLRVVMTGEIRRARVAWKRENSAGLSFLLERRTGFGNAGTPGQ